MLTFYIILKFIEIGTYLFVNIHRNIFTIIAELILFSSVEYLKNYWNPIRKNNSFNYTFVHSLIDFLFL